MIERLEDFPREAALLADLMLVVHALIVAFVIAGQLLILIGWARHWQWVRNRWFRLAHLATIVTVVLQAWLGRLCPLTVWERWLRPRRGRRTLSRASSSTGLLGCCTGTCRGGSS